MVLWLPNYARTAEGRTKREDEVEFFVNHEYVSLVCCQVLAPFDTHLARNILLVVRHNPFLLNNCIPNRNVRGREKCQTRRLLIGEKDCRQGCSGRWWQQVFWQQWL